MYSMQVKGEWESHTQKVESQNFLDPVLAKP